MAKIAPHSSKNLPHHGLSSIGYASQSVCEQFRACGSGHHACREKRKNSYPCRRRDKGAFGSYRHRFSGGARRFIGLHLRPVRRGAHCSGGGDLHQPDARRLLRIDEAGVLQCRCFRDHQSNRGSPCVRAARRRGRDRGVPRVERSP